MPRAREGRSPEAREGCPKLGFGASLPHFPLLKWLWEARLVRTIGNIACVEGSIELS